MRINNIRHKGLQRFIEDEDMRGLAPAVCRKIRRMVSFLRDMAHEGELAVTPHWKPHRLIGEGGEGKARWSLHVTKNWRLTFHIDSDRNEIVDLDYEDYH